MLQLPSGEQDDGWEARPKPPGESGIWIVVKLNVTTPEGEWTREPRRSVLRGAHKTWLGEADSGIKAIQDFYLQELDKCEDDDRTKADGRYVALDFYGGERVEALVTGDWKVDMAIAPKALGPKG